MSCAIVGRREIAHPALAAAAPAVQDVQHDGTRVETWPARRDIRSRRGGDAFAQRVERRRWFGITGLAVRYAKRTLC
jgi:hypothetical protein